MRSSLGTLWGIRSPFGGLLGVSILALFANGEEGAVFDFSPENLFQDIQGTMPVLSPADPVGLALDTSKGVKSVRVLGPNLTPDLGGWIGVNATVSVVGDTLEVTDAGGYASARRVISTEVGKTYLFRVNIPIGNNFNVDVYNGSDFTATPPDIFAGGALPSGVHYLFFVAQDTTTTVSLRGNSSNGAVYEFKDIAVQKYEQSFVGLEADLAKNGDFDTTSDWSLDVGSTISGGVLELDASAAATFVRQTGYMFNSGLFLITLNASEVSGFCEVRSEGGGGGISSVRTLEDGENSFFWRSPNPDTTLTFSVSSGGYCLIDKVSVRPLPGNHATQATAAKRPAYGIVPATGRRNLFTYTEDFTNASWAKFNTTVSGSTVSALTSGSFRYVKESVSLSVGQTYTAYFDLEYTDTQWVWLLGETSGNTFFWFDILNGVIGSSGNTVGGAIVGESYSHSIEPLAGGGFRCKITFTKTSATGSEEVGVGLSDSDAVVTATAGQSVSVLRAQLETGSTATPYQKVVSDLEVTEAGVPSLDFLRFDGVDDFMVTPSIDFTGTDKMSVFAGVRKLSDASAGMVAELSTSVANNGTFAALAPPGAGSAAYGFNTRGTINRAVNGFGFPAVDTAVISGLGDISGDLSTLRVDGTQVAQSTADQGASNYGDYPLYIGARAGSSLFFNGDLYSLIVRGALSTDAEIASTESYAAKKTGVTL